MRAVVIALASFAFLIANVEASPSANSMSNVLLAYRFVTAGDARIGVYWGDPSRFQDWERTDGYPDADRFAPGTALALAPAVALAALAGAHPNDTMSWAYLDKLMAALLVSAAAAVTYLAARRVAGERAALIATFALVAGTSLATVAAQRTWQHPAGVLAVAVGWLWLVRGCADDRWTARAGLPLAFAIIVRYPVAVVWAAALAYVVLSQRHAALRFLLWSVPPLAFLALYDAAVFGSPAQNSYGAQIWQWSSPDGLAGNLVSPSRGLLVYSPFFVFAVRALVRRARSRDPLAWLALAGFGVMLAVHGLYIEWWGGWSYGNRYLLEATPLLATGVALAWRDAGVGLRRYLGATIAFAAILQLAGLLGYYHYWDGYNWDATRETAEGARAMWDLRDPQWLWTIRSALATATTAAAVLVPTMIALLAAACVVGTRTSAGVRSGGTLPA